MSTRSGRHFKPTMDDLPAQQIESDTQRHTPTASGTSTESNAPTTAQPDLTSVLDVMRTMMVDRERREREITEERQRQEAERAEERQRQEAERAEERQRQEAEHAEERRRYEEESERRVTAMNKQLEMLQNLVLGHTERAAKRDSDTMKLTRLTETDDIESYLTTFERMLTAYEVDKARWAFKLAPQLTGRAQQAYAALDPSDAECYATVKAAILRRYNINDETYRQRFRSYKYKVGQTPTEIATRLTDLAGRWLKDCSTMEEVKDAVVKEQLLAVLPEDIRMWVKERKPKATTEAAQLAEDYLQARPTGIPKSDRLPTGPCPRCGEHGHWARHCPNNPKQENQEQAKTQGSRQSQPRYAEQSRNGSGQRSRPSEQGPRSSDGIKCYNCNERGHLSYNCPQKALFSTQSPAIRQQERAYHQGTVNGVYCRDIVVDTGASKTLVRGDLVTPDDIIDGEVTIQCAHGDTVSYPLAAVKITLDGKDIITHAAVADSLPVAVLLGWDVPELVQLVKTDGATKALAAVTRRQWESSTDPTDLPVTTDSAPTEDQEQIGPIHIDSAGEEPFIADIDDVAPPTETSDREATDFAFDDSLFSPPGPEKRVLTRSQKRAARRRYKNPEENGALPGSLQSLDISADQLRDLQDKDPSLEDVRRAAAGEGKTTDDWEFFRQDGLLYRRRQDQSHSEQLVLPISCRNPVLQLAHDIPMAGHLGRRKTRRRILQRFYWPGLYRDVRDYCRSCHQCQKSSPRGTRRAPLIPLPIIDVPFRRVAMDIVGPLPRSSTGKRFILVICDYATRYPEAIALRTIDANQIARALVSFFSRVGLPEEILTDQGTNFTSQLLQEVYRLLRIKPIRTTPYHPQTDGLVERFNQTLKSMLKKTANKEGKNWDELLPYLLFAYREVPQASTGFSPFELVYGRPVRGPLDILKESWESSPKSSESVVSYVLLMQERLQNLRDLVRINLEQAQTAQKLWYDRNARSRAFDPGDQVLVLLPTSNNKLLAEWQGPYQITRRVSKVNYEVRMTHRRKQKQILHINMLRAWHAPTAVSYWADDVTEDGDEGNDPITYFDTEPDGEPVYGDSLSPAQYADLRTLWNRFPTTLNSDPGRTGITEHRINTGAAKPVRLPPYRIPHAYRDIVCEELRQMEKAGIIERSSSEWAAPIVLVKKKDATLRMCVDYRRLNAVSEMDAYPMPRVDDLIDRLGGAKFITTLDLSRGYWQVPVRKEDQPKTAFTTPYGLFQFKVMPFGLQGAPATFQRMMDVLLNEMSAFAAAYLDDVIIHSETWDEHVTHVSRVFQCLDNAGLTVKPRKCQFAMSTCTYLGHIVGNGEVRPDASKVKAVEDFPVPKSKSQVRAFLGLTGYYRRFIPGYAQTAAALTDLTRKEAPNRVAWTPECQKAFATLQQALCSAAILRSPDFSRQFILQTDASNRGVGAVLSQRDDDEIERPIAYYSRKLLPREERYSTVEKECLAIRLATHAFRVYLLGKHFLIQTDHRSLKWLHQLKDTNARLTRWSLSLQPYCYTVEYRAGSCNGNADGLSRAFADTTSSQEKGEEM